MPKVPVFLSFSGPRSCEVAKLLRAWLPDVLQTVEPWTSAVDIETGERWGVKIGEELQDTHFGILCLTPENTDPDPAPWIMFEAGALSKQTDIGRVTSLCCFGVSFGSLKSPLNQFQNSRPDDRESMIRLVSSINTQLGENALASPEAVRRQVERCWAEWESGLSEAEKAAPSVEPKKPDISDQLGEMLERLRAIEKNLVSVRDMDVLWQDEHNLRRELTLAESAHQTAAMEAARAAEQRKTAEGALALAQKCGEPSEGLNLLENALAGASQRVTAAFAGMQAHAARVADIQRQLQHIDSLRSGSWARF